MRDLIARALGRARRPVLATLLARLLPASGRHRRIPVPAPARLRRTGSARPAPTGARAVGRIPAPRSPYSREQARPLDGADSALVRPYWAAHERATREWVARRRRRVLWLATMGLDLDTRNIHAAAGGARW
ncbi:hypothetical protein [Streptomyces radiopugnans]|uniref:Uncharacterized protein n=1 Tax=Streptomyces radiopugnans TaxID=403935 RepID=A0A1H9HVG7_9ACTN|nr:hypothetical protein [Streptomyces radiopugnans]SEQ66331.1 hypothetical protein SAMN05216481_11255 [Streptomyces radiopugnans]